MPPKPTHFLSLPLSSSPANLAILTTALSHFTNTVTRLRTPELSSGIPASAIRPRGTLHLTLGVMNLETPERVDEARSFLAEIDLCKAFDAESKRGGEGGREVEGDASGNSKGKDSTNITGGDDSTSQAFSKPEPPAKSTRLKPLHISLTSLRAMGNPSASTVLYAVPLSHPSSRPNTLQSFCTSIRAVFLSSGLLIPETRPLLLHATIINTVYMSKSDLEAFAGGGGGSSSERGGGMGRRGGGGNDKRSGRGSKEKLTLNLSDLLEDWEDYVWADYLHLNKLAICRMGARVNPATGEEEYVVEAERKLPGILK